MKVIIRQPIENRQPLSIENGLLKLGSRIIGMPVPYEENEIVFYFSTVSGRITSIDAERLFCERDGASLLATRGCDATETPLAVMWSGSTDEDPYMIMIAPCSPDGSFEYGTLTDEQAEMPLLSLVGSLSEHAAKRLINMNAKNRLLHAVVPQNALAALEKQVDMLTCITAKLVELIPEEKRPAWTADFFAAIERTTSMSVKSPEELISEITEQKSSIRSAQLTYFSERVDV